MKTSKTEKAEALSYLRELLPRGSTVYTVLRSVSKSGMSRRIDLYVVKKGEIQFISGWVGAALGYSRGNGEGLRVDGCGMDMGFHLVNSLSYALHGNKNHNAEGYKRSGYTLNHRWI